jgi:hypothetical protein
MGGAGGPEDPASAQNVRVEVESPLDALPEDWAPHGWPPPPAAGAGWTDPRDTLHWLAADHALELAVERIAHTHIRPFPSPMTGPPLAEMTVTLRGTGDARNLRAFLKSLAGQPLLSHVEELLAWPGSTGLSFTLCVTIIALPGGPIGDG